MYVSVKMRLVETIPSMGREGIRRMIEEVNSTVIYYKYFCKCHNIPYNSTIKNKYI
jgi:hypothetical protein